MTDKNNQEKIKITVMGGGGVGKSCVVFSYLYDQFQEEYDPTVEDSFRKLMHIKGNGYLLDILDTAGQGEYAPLRESWVKEGDGFFLVYAIISRDSFDELETYFELINNIKPTAPFLVFGNKYDLEKSREVPNTEADEYVAKKSSETFKGKNFFEGSALTKKNIAEAFEYLVLEISKFKNSQPNKGEGKKKTGGPCALL